MAFILIGRYVKVKGTSTECAVGIRMPSKYLPHLRKFHDSCVTYSNGDAQVSLPDMIDETPLRTSESIDLSWTDVCETYLVLKE